MSDLKEIRETLQRMDEKLDRALEGVSTNRADIRWFKTLGTAMVGFLGFVAKKIGLI